MKPFMDEEFLLQSEAAKTLYHRYAEKMPIIDYHCHVNPADIALDKRYSSVSDVWLGGDHYKWRLIRANGTPECEITGAREKDPALLFRRFAEALPRAVGNPVYHWTHLELKRYFGISEPLTASNWESVYSRCNAKLQEAGMSVRGLIDQSNVKVIGTTDDPVDDLAWHKKIKEDASCKVKVVPSFRPDKAINLEKPDFAAYITRLSEVSGVAVKDYASLCDALANRIDFFDDMGCRASDHALESCVYEEASPAELDVILKKALSGEKVTVLEGKQYRTAVLVRLGAEYAKRGWVMQIHFGCMRDNNSRLFKTLGPDTGFDSLNGNGQPEKLSPFLDRMQREEALPRMVLYSLNPADSEVIACIAACFMADAECPGKIQLGAAWWFSDTKSGMEKQLLDYANSTLLGNFIGMLTDSRSFLSYTRHEYFRRILCNFIGNLIENGEYPADFEAAGKMVEDICYNNTARFFGFEA